MPTDTNAPGTPSVPAPSATPSMEDLIERALARQTTKIEEVVRAQLTPHSARLDQVCARLTALEGRSASETVDVSVATGGDTSSSSIPAPTSPSNAHIVEVPPVAPQTSLPSTATSQIPSRIRDSARETWDGMTSSERSAWRAYHAGVGQQAPPPPVTQPSIPPSAPPASGRPLQCNPELLP
ncbi:hypothetical protein CF327_g7171 [Tilletia walkeri]|nr:hypothetical protein CF327_g7171 [Tilletia walkeri]